MKIQDSVTKAPTPIPAPAEKLPFSSRPFAEPAAPEVTSAQPNTLHYSLRTISLAVQPKLTIGQPNDKYEQEADRVAKEVVQRINAPQSSTTRFNNPDPNTTGNGKPKLQLKPIFQRRSAIEGDATPDLESSINQARGGGQALDVGLQRKMGQAMGADFSRVKVHTDSQSDQLNKSIQAKAFTTGKDVFFRQGAYEPGSRGGQELIAHELTHVVQQCSDPPPSMGVRLQRKVGFEFEEQNWRSYVSTSWESNPLYEDKDIQPEVSPNWVNNPLYEDKDAQPEVSPNWVNNPLYEDKDAQPEVSPNWVNNPLYEATAKPSKQAEINIYKRPPGSHINDSVKPYGVEAPAKKAILHKGTSFNLEADGPYDKGMMSIEFVTKPFDETKQGIKELDEALDQMEKIMKRLGKYAGKNALNGQFVQPEEHKLSTPLVYLAGGAKEADFKMQATQGIQLSSIPLLQKAFGNVPNETTKEEKQHKTTRMMMEKADEPAKDVMGKSPAQAEVAMQCLVQEGVKFGESDIKPMTGYLSYMLMYIQMLAYASHEGLKVNLPLMSRYSFSELYEMLSEPLKTRLREKAGTKALLKAIVKGLGRPLSTPLIGVEPNMMKTFKSSYDNLPIEKQQFYKLMSSITIQDWVEGVLVGKDYLTYKDASSLFASKGQGEFAPSAKVYLRGHGNAKNVQREDGSDDYLAVMENRAILPKGNITMSRAKDISRDYLAFIIKINQENKTLQDL